MNAGPAAVATAPPPPPAYPPMMQHQHQQQLPLRAPNAPPPLQQQQQQQQQQQLAPSLLPAAVPVPAMTMPAGPPAALQRAPSIAAAPAPAPYAQLTRPPPRAAFASAPPPPLSLPHATPGVQQQQHPMVPVGLPPPPPPPTGLAFPPLRAPLPAYALPTRTPSVALPPPPPPSSAASAVGAGAALTRVLALAAEWAPAPGTTAEAAHQLAHWHAVVARHFVPSATWRYTTPAAAAPAGGDASAAAAAAAPRAFELPYGFLPRYFALQYATGLVSAHLALDAPAREVVLPTGGRVLHAPKVSITHRFATGAVVVADALLRVTLVPAMVAHDAWGLKIEFWDLVVRRAEELVPRPAVARAVAEWHADVDAAFRARSAGGPASPTGLDAVAPKLKLPEAMTNEYGVAVRLMRALEIADVVNSMRDIIVYSQVKSVGAFQALQEIAAAIDENRRTAASTSTGAPPPAISAAQTTTTTTAAPPPPPPPPPATTSANGDSARQRSLPTPQPSTSPPNVAVGSPRAGGGGGTGAATAAAGASGSAPAPAETSNGAPAPSNGVASPVPPSPTFSDTALAIKSEPPSPSNNGTPPSKSTTSTPPALGSPTLAKRKSPMSSSTSPSSVSSLSSTPPSPAAAAPRKVPRLDDGAMGPRSPTATHAALKKRAAGGQADKLAKDAQAWANDNTGKIKKLSLSLDIVDKMRFNDSILATLANIKDCVVEVNKQITVLNDKIDQTKVDLTAEIKSATDLVAMIEESITLNNKELCAEIVEVKKQLDRLEAMVVNQEGTPDQVAKIHAKFILLRGCLCVNL
ncbi:hypothetical protein GGF31_003283 [Allomyces arbusculus]|nr:hypothetical protein GGF31_003283 [Allomyces arbusculus]